MVIEEVSLSPSNFSYFLFSLVQLFTLSLPTYTMIDILQNSLCFYLFLMEHCSFLKNVYAGLVMTNCKKNKFGEG